MAIAYRTVNVTTGTDATAEGSLTGITDGDLMLAFLNHTSSTATMTTPASGWDLVEADPNPADFSCLCYKRIKQAGDSAPVWTWSAAGAWTVDIIAYSGVDQTTPVNTDIGEQVAGANAIALGAITPTVNDCMIVGWASTDATGGARTWTQSDTPTERLDQMDNAHHRSIAEWLLSGGSGVGVTRTFTVSGSAQDLAGFLVALAPGAVAVTGTGAVTLDAVTSSGAATVPIAGTAVTTLGNATSAGAGTVPIDGIGTATLAGATSQGVATVPITGVGSTTLDAVASAAAGSVAITGTGASVLGAVTNVSAGVVIRSPTTAPGIKAWWVADETELGDGDPVDTWLDVSGNLNHATQANATKQPVVSLGPVLNGHRVVEFDGGDALSTAANIGVGPEWTVFAVANTSLSTEQQIVSAFFPGTSVFQVRFNNATTLLAASNGTGGVNTDTYPRTSSVPVVVSAVRGPTSIEVFGNSLGNGATTTTGTPTSATRQIWLGANTDTTNHLTGYIAEALFYNRALTTEERNEIEYYLKTKYDVGTTSGTGAATLGAVTSQGAGVVPIAGTGSATLGAVTSQGAGTVPIAGTGAATLGDATSTGAGTVAIGGSGAATLDAVTGTGTGTVAIGGTGAATLDAVTSQGSGALGANPIDGTGAVTLGAVTSQGVGTVAVTGTGSATLGAISSTSAGAVAIAGTGATTLAGVTAQGVGVVAIAGAGVATLVDIGAFGAGTVAIVGTGAATLDAITSQGVAAEGGVVQRRTLFVGRAGSRGPLG